MRIIRIYQHHETNINITTGKTLILDQTASHHLTNVLRQKIGDSCVIFTGDGYDYQAEIINITKRECSVKIISSTKINNESPLQIHLFQGIAKSDKMDWIIQKAVELGVTAISPFFSEYCDVKLPQERIQKKLEHWNKIILSACEQSGRAIIPSLNSPIYFQDIPNENINLFFDPSAQTTIKTLLNTEQPTTINIIIGPEGGFSNQEIVYASEHWKLATLGPRILRTETAAIAAISVLQVLAGDF